MINSVYKTLAFAYEMPSGQSGTPHDYKMKVLKSTALIAIAAAGLSFVYKAAVRRIAFTAVVLSIAVYVAMAIKYRCIALGKPAPILGSFAEFVDSIVSFIFCSRTSAVNTPSKEKDNTHTTPYNFDEEILKVRELAKTLPLDNKKLCLMVGITQNESLPSDKGEAKENEVWVSLDIQPVINKLDPKRIHLQMDMNDQEALEKISGCFDKVVLDISVLKYFKDLPWLRLQCLLTPRDDSTLITEASTGGYGISDFGFSDPTCASLIIPQKEYFRAFEGKPQEDGSIITTDELTEKYEKLLQKRTIKYLGSLFSCVLFVDHEAYPYKNLSYPHPVSYYYLSGPRN